MRKLSMQNLKESFWFY